MHMASKLKIHKSTRVFKINVFKLNDKYSKLMKSSVTLGFLKNLITKILSKSAIEIQASLHK